MVRLTRTKKQMMIQIHHHTINHHMNTIVYISPLSRQSGEIMFFESWFVVISPEKHHIKNKGVLEYTLLISQPVLIDTTKIRKRFELPNLFLIIWCQYPNGICQFTVEIIRFMWIHYFTVKKSTSIIVVFDF